LRFEKKHRQPLLGPLRKYGDAEGNQQRSRQSNGQGKLEGNEARNQEGKKKDILKGDHKREKRARK
jgi:hypothetical protein